MTPQKQNPKTEKGLKKLDRYTDWTKIDRNIYLNQWDLEQLAKNGKVDYGYLVILTRDKYEKSIKKNEQQN